MQYVVLAWDGNNVPGILARFDNKADADGFAASRSLPEHVEVSVVSEGEADAKIARLTEELETTAASDKLETTEAPKPKK